MRYAAFILLALGGVMYLRGWIYTLRPDGKIAEKRKRRNLKIGFPTDMKLFGRKVRRLGFMILLTAAGILGWDLSRDDGGADAAATNAAAPPADESSNP